MNVNYLWLPKQPSFDKWSDALQVIADGDYFTTTGEVLLPNAKLTGDAGSITAKADVQWTFPLRVAEIVWGDGMKTHTKTIPLTSTKEFAKQQFTWTAQTPNWTWARLAIWDVAGNGAFTTPIWKP